MSSAKQKNKRLSFSKGQILILCMLEHLVFYTKKIQWLGELAQKNEFINNLPPTHRNFVVWILPSSCDFSPLSGFLHCQTSVWSPLGAQKKTQSSRLGSAPCSLESCLSTPLLLCRTFFAFSSACYILPSWKPLSSRYLLEAKNNLLLSTRPM